VPDRDELDYGRPEHSLGQHLGPGGVHAVGDLSVEGGEEVSVQAERSRHIGVAEPLLDGYRVRTLGYC